MGGRRGPASAAALRRRPRPRSPTPNPDFDAVGRSARQASGTPVVGIKGSYMDRIIFTNQTHWARENTPAALAEAIRQRVAPLGGVEIEIAPREPIRDAPVFPE